jgi:hypothetical protein
MTLLDFVEAWWLSVRALLEANGVVGRFERSPINRPNPSCVLNLRRNEMEVDLLVWESGEAELAIIEPGGSNQQHFDDIRTTPNLSTILSNLVYSVSDSGAATNILRK